MRGLGRRGTVQAVDDNEEEVEVKLWMLSSVVHLITRYRECSGHVVVGSEQAAVTATVDEHNYGTSFDLSASCTTFLFPS